MSLGRSTNAPCGWKHVVGRTDWLSFLSASSVTALTLATPTTFCLLEAFPHHLQQALDCFLSVNHHTFIPSSSREQAVTNCSQHALYGDLFYEQAPETVRLIDAKEGASKQASPARQAAGGAACGVAAVSTGFLVVRPETSLFNFTYSTTFDCFLPFHSIRCEAFHSEWLSHVVANFPCSWKLSPMPCETGFPHHYYYSNLMTKFSPCDHHFLPSWVDRMVKSIHYCGNDYH